MAVALTVLDIDNSGKTTYLTCKATLSGNYSTGGDTVDLTTVVNKEYLGKVFVAAKSPLYGWAACSTGASMAIILGTTMANGKLKINTASNTELAAGAYAAQFTGDASIFLGFAFDQSL